MVTARDLQQRAETFAIDVIKTCRDLPMTPEGRHIRGAATAVAANYRATCRARSRAEFVAKLGVVVEEADESHMWLGMILQLELLEGSEALRLYKEADELTAIFTASKRTASRTTRS